MTMDQNVSNSTNRLQSSASALPLHNGYNPHVMYSCDTFCSEDNVDQSLVYISQEFSSLGFPSIFSSSQTCSYTISCDIIKYINITYDLLHLHRNFIQSKAILEQRNASLYSDLDALQNNQAHLRNALEQSERKCISVQEKERQLIEQCKSLQSQLKVQKDETKKLASSMQQQKTAFQHELKKHERLNNQMKEKMHQLLTDKNSDRRYGSMDILSTVPRKNNQRAKWKTAASTNSHLEDMYNSVITSYESRCQEQLKELSTLQSCLKFVQEKMLLLISQLKGDITSNAGNSEMLCPTKVLSDLLFLSYSSKKLKEDFEIKFDLIKSAIEKLQDCNDVENDLKQHEAIDENIIEEFAELKAKLARYESNFEESKKSGQVDTLENGVGDKEKKWIEDERVAFEKEKHNLAREKESISKERAILQDAVECFKKEKEVLENQKLELLRSQIMCSKISTTFENGHCFLPSVPVLTTRDGIITIPNAKEFQRYLCASDNSPECKDLPLCAEAKTENIIPILPETRAFKKEAENRTPRESTPADLNENICEKNDLPKWSLNYITADLKPPENEDMCIINSYCPVGTSNGSFPVLETCVENVELDEASTSSSDEQNLLLLQAAFGEYEKRRSSPDASQS